MGRGRQRRPRRAPQHRARVAPADEEGDVRVALADALRLEPTGADPARVEERLQGLRTTAGRAHLEAASCGVSTTSGEPIGRHPNSCPGDRIDRPGQVSNVRPDENCPPVPLVLIALFVLVAPRAPGPVGERSRLRVRAEERTIDVGDTVTWNFKGPIGAHLHRQSGSGREVGLAARGRGRELCPQFTKPGKYQYFCRPHAEFMKGTVTVGKDTAAKSFTSVKVKGASRRSSSP